MCILAVRLQNLNSPSGEPMMGFVEIVERAGVGIHRGPTGAGKSTLLDAMAQAFCSEPEARKTLAGGETTGPIADPCPALRRALEGRENGTNATRRPGSSRAPSGARRCGWANDLKPGGFTTGYLLASLRLVAAPPHEEQVFNGVSAVA